MTDEDRKKEYLKNYYNERKKLLNHIINPDKESENVYIDK